MEKICNILKSSRIDRNLTVEEISNELKIPKTIINKLESDKIQFDYDIVYYIGHLRSYCNLLELDSDFVVNKFKKEVSFLKNNFVEKISKPKIQNENYKYQKYISAFSIIIIFTSFYFLFVQEDNKSQQFALVPDLPESFIPIIEKADLIELDQLNTESNKNNSIIESEIFKFTSVEASSEPNKIKNNHTVTLKILNPTWLQLRDQSDKIIISRLMDKDEEYSYDMILNYNITAGNAGNILVIINNDVRGKIGSYGDIVDSFTIDNKFYN